jgi:hypothetical protein
LSIIISAMLIVLSRAFSLRNLEQVAKTEFIYAASTVFIVMMVITLITTVEAQLGSAGLAKSLYLIAYRLPADLSLAGGGSAVPITDPFDPNNDLSTLVDWMKLYMSAPAECIPRFMRVLYAMEIPVGAATSIYMEIFMSEHASGFGFKWVEERIMNAVQSFTFYMYMFYLLIHVFDFIKAYAGFFFSIGVALRAFPPTRGAGAYVMALSFGLYFVYPLSYIVVATLFMPHASSELVNAQNVGGSYQTVCSLPPEIDVSSMSCGSANPMRVRELANLLQAYSGSITDVLTIHVNSFGRHMVYAICVFPLIAFTILLTFVLNTTQLFGGNIPEIGRGIVKLI